MKRIMTFNNDWSKKKSTSNLFPSLPSLGVVDTGPGGVGTGPFGVDTGPKK